MDILLGFLAGTGITGLATYIIKTFLTEKIKAQIKSEYDIKFESVKKELERKATEHQIHYSKLHIDRSEKLKEIFNALIDTEDTLENLTTIHQGPAVMKFDRDKIALEAYRSLYFKILRNRIYFETDFLDRLEVLIKDYKKVIDGMANLKDQLRLEQRMEKKHEEDPIQKWID